MLTQPPRLEQQIKTDYFRLQNQVLHIYAKMHHFSFNHYLNATHIQQNLPLNTGLLENRTSYS